MVSAVDTLTADRVQRFPDKDGTIALTSDISGTNSGTNTGDITVTDSAEIDFTLTGQALTASLIAGSIDETKLDASVNASLDLADTSVQLTGDQTIAGAKAFSSTTRPTSSGTGTPAATSLITLADGDARYGKSVIATRAGSSLTLTSSTYVVGMTSPVLPVGTYLVSGYLPVYGGNTSVGSKRKITGGTATITGGRGVYSNSSNAFTAASNIAAEISAAHGSTPVFWVDGQITVSVEGTVQLEVAQVTTDAANPSQLAGGATLRFEKIY